MFLKSQTNKIPCAKLSKFLLCIRIICDQMEHEICVNNMSPVLIFGTVKQAWAKNPINGVKTLESHAPPAAVVCPDSTIGWGETLKDCEEHLCHSAEEKGSEKANRSQGLAPVLVKRGKVYSSVGSVRDSEALGETVGLGSST